jgi:uncharacterized membrane-anchored protein
MKNDPQRTDLRPSDQGDTAYHQMLCKVPEVTVYFWIIKVLCTTVGETASDFMSENLGLGLTGTSIAMGLLLTAVLMFQFRAKRYVPVLYWLTVVLISVFGTLVTDILTDSLGVPLEASTAVFSVALAITFAVWCYQERTLSIHSIFTKRRELFYWLAILFTFALGTASGDLMAESLGLGYFVTGIIVCAVIAVTAIAWCLTLDAVLAFWLIYILTRPLGASLGDYLSQTQAHGGLGLGATATTAGFLIAILAVVIFLTVTRRDFIARPSTQVASPGKNPAVLWQVVAVVVVLVLMSGAGYFWRRTELRNEAAASVSPTAPLGDLSPFQRIAADTLGLVGAGDLAAAKARIGDLEFAWDNATARLRAMNEQKWSMVDDAIDEALKKLRSGTPDPTACTAALQTLISTCAVSATAQAASTAPATKPQAAHSGALGDLAPFRSIAEDTLSLVDRHDLAAAKTRIKDLERAWDAAEERLQPMNPDDWTIVDEAIDHALAELRTAQPDAATCAAALKRVIAQCKAL